jgi:hypothetical protein
MQVKPKRIDMGRCLRKTLGFNESYYVRQGEDSYWRPRCSQCEALVINGMACHETGCPNDPARRRWGNDE